MAKIPQILRMLEGHNDRDELRESAIEVFKKLASNREYYLPFLCSLAMSVLAIFHHEIEPRIPFIIGLLKDRDPVICESALGAFEVLVDNAIFHEALKPGIPLIIDLIRGTQFRLRKFALDVLGKLADIPILQGAVKAGVASVIHVLENPAILGENDSYSLLRAALEERPPEILDLLRWAVMSMELDTPEDVYFS
ncbi:hypothetical protein FB45DRAFT_217476 [Roridomyces roridus]|uniref:Uncharacterized protein n=1 Tax=Roridomyces roridus TaxID=1738132 RepID=A0AAD7BE96_9AGAR|nr:hypothetical protein FB45DRAFT_217476 [Roridomyces roridus]